MNFDEELLVIFFSILQYISDTFGFRTDINFGFKLITGAKFKRYLNGYGRNRLRQIKYKYFSDTAVKLWNLCYAFFDKSYQIRVNTNPSEYLLVKSFHIVFEAMIDELIGDKNIPAGLKEQEDGKLVDHFYTYPGLLINDKPDDDIYYIGDSKYYKLGNSLGSESIYKQRTYARNVIQWNLNIWLDGKADMNDRFERIRLFDPVTEGYNIIPNFFISAAIDKETLSYEDRTVPHPIQPPVSRQFKNRLYDRDTLLLSHYDVNFLFVLALYARDNSGAKAAWRGSIRKKFRTAVQVMLKDKFEFYALAAHPDVDASEYFKTHFQDTLGKTFRPYENPNIYSLALDNSYPEENNRLLAALGDNFYIVKCPLGVNPTAKITEVAEKTGDVSSPDGRGMAFTVYIPSDESVRWKQHSVRLYRSRSIPEGNILRIKYIIPIIDGCIDGYYNISKISFGMSDSKEGKPPEPRVIFTLGDFIPFGEDWAIVNASGIRTLSWGEIISIDKAGERYHNAPKKITY